MTAWLSDAWLDELRNRANIADVISQYVPLKARGRRLWACCPFHHEKTPSFSVNPEMQMFYCFGCHRTGTVIHFVMEMEHLEFLDAVKLLAEKVGMPLPAGQESEKERFSSEARQRLFDANRTAALFFYNRLYTDDGTEILKYLYTRGLSDADIKRFGLGASPLHGGTLTEYMIEKGFSIEELRQAGLAVERSGDVRDMFFGRAMFPIIDGNGHVLGFGGRAMGNAQPKYLNTAETPIFNKRQGLYAMNFVRKERPIDHLVLVEGYMDTIQMRKAGVQGVVATLGTALTEEQARLMKRYAPEVWISYDGDAAGQKAALRALDILEPQGLRVRVLDYPEGMDPDDYIKAKGKDGFDALPKFTAAEYRMRRARDGLDMATQEGLTEYTMRCCAILKSVPNPVEVENYVRKLAAETGYDRDVLLKQIDSTQGTTSIERPRIRQAPPSDKLTRSERAQWILLALCASGRTEAASISEEDFQTERCRKFAKWLIGGGSTGAYIDSLEDPREREHIVAALNNDLPQEREDVEALIKSCYREIRTEHLNQKAKEIREKIKTANSEEKRSLYEQLKRINLEMDAGAEGA